MKITLVCRGRRWPGLALAAALLVSLVLPACGDSTTNISDIPRAVFVISVEPSPVIGAQNFLTGSVSAAYVVRIRELAGLGGTVQFVNSTVFEPETGLQVAVNYFDSADLKVFVGTDRVEPGGELVVSQTTNYTLPDLQITADLTVNVQAVDDRGNLSNQSTLVRVVPPE